MTARTDYLEGALAAWKQIARDFAEAGLNDERFLAARSAYEDRVATEYLSSGATLPNGWAVNE